MSKLHGRVPRHSPLLFWLNWRVKKKRMPGNEAMVHGVTRVVRFHITMRVSWLCSSVDPFAGIRSLSTLESKRLFCYSVGINSLSWASLRSGVSRANCSLLWSETVVQDGRPWTTANSILHSPLLFVLNIFYISHYVISCEERYQALPLLSLLTTMESWAW